MGSGTWNGKAGGITLMTVAWYAGRGWFVAPKLPGLKTVSVDSAEDGKSLADRIWAEWAREVF